MPAPRPESIEAFASDIEELLQRTVLVSTTFPGSDTRQLDDRVTVRTRPSDPVVLIVTDRPLLTLDLTFQLTLARDGSYLRVEQSSFQVHSTVKKTEPLFRYDFVAEPQSTAVPTAHVHMYGHRDELLHAMYVSRRARSRPAASQDLDPSKPRGLGMLHFPVGGTRFRPCLEDLLEFLIQEFGIDVVEGWEETLAVGRIGWRHIQLASAIRDDPETARRALAELDAGAPTHESRLARF